MKRRSSRNYCSPEGFRCLKPVLLRPRCEVEWETFVPQIVLFLRVQTSAKASSRLCHSARQVRQPHEPKGRLEVFVATEVEVIQPEFGTHRCSSASPCAKSASRTGRGKGMSTTPPG